MLLTYKFRVKDKHAAELNRQARAVNFVWNFCNETQKHALKWGKAWPSGYDLCGLTAGSAPLLGIHAQTIQRVCRQYATSRRTHTKRSLRWRSRKSLGWVPFSTGAISYKDCAFTFRGKRYDVWLSRELPKGARIGAGSFNQDAKGNWYINCPVEVPGVQSAGTASVGIDLGLKSFAVMSDGEAIEAQRFYRDLEPALAVAQRANNKKRVKAIHAKIANRRKDHLHKLSTRLVRENGAIFVGNVNAVGLAKTKMAKSVLDAGWSSFRAMLEYKAIRHQVLFAEVDEAWSTQTCHECGSIAGPKGQTGLNEREWDCPDCGAHHLRDVNAASNIRERGHALLAGGTRASTRGGCQMFMNRLQLAGVPQ
jgi:IS605 OrfB family transposase